MQRAKSPHGKHPEPAPVARHAALWPMVTQTFKGPVFAAHQAGRPPIEADDVHQGTLGNCYMMAALAAIAQAQPEILQRIVRDRGDGTYEVTLHETESRFLGLTEEHVPRTIVVTPEFPTVEGQAMYARPQGPPGGKELWPLLLEKAFAKRGNGYASIDGGGLGSEVMTAVTGSPSEVWTPSVMNPAKLLTAVTEAFVAKRPMTVQFPCVQPWTEEWRGLADRHEILANHSYTVVAVDGVQVTLRNPYGHRHPHGVTLDLLRAIAPAQIHVALAPHKDLVSRLLR